MEIIAWKFMYNYLVWIFSIYNDAVENGIITLTL